VSEPTSCTTERRPETDGGSSRARTRAARYPHAPERLPESAGRFLGLLDRSRRA
jgi:hypothetical protein